MDGTGGFSASNRSRDNSPRRSDCRGSWLCSGEKKSWRNFSLSPDFACTSTTGSPMDKWMAQADSAHQIGPETTLQGVLIVEEVGCAVGKKRAGGIFHSRPILPVPQKPVVRWTNGWHRRIQRIK